MAIERVTNCFRLPVVCTTSTSLGGSSTSSVAAPVRTRSLGYDLNWCHAQLEHKGRGPAALAGLLAPTDLPVEPSWHFAHGRRL